MCKDDNSSTPEQQAFFTDPTQAVNRIPSDYAAQIQQLIATFGQHDEIELKQRVKKQLDEWISKESIPAKESKYNGQIINLGDVADLRKQADTLNQNLANDQSDLVQTKTQQTDFDSFISRNHQRITEIDLQETKNNNEILELEDQLVESSENQTFRRRLSESDIESIIMMQTLEEANYRLDSEKEITKRKLTEMQDRFQKLINRNEDQTKRIEGEVQNLSDLNSRIKNRLSDSSQSELIVNSSSNKDEQEPHDVNSSKESIEMLEQLMNQFFGTHPEQPEVDLTLFDQYYLYSPKLDRHIDAPGREKLRRMNRMLGVSDYALNQLTTAYDPYLADTWYYYEETGLALKDSKLDNLYASILEFDKEWTTHPFQVKIHATWTAKENHAQHLIAYFEENLPVLTVHHRENDSLWYIEYFDRGKLFKSDFFDLQGQLAATQYFDIDKGSTLTSELLYRYDGKPGIQKNYLNNQPMEITLLDLNNEVTKIFDDEQELALWWISEKVLTSQSALIVNIGEKYFNKLVDADRFEVIPFVSRFDLDNPTVTRLCKGEYPITNIFVDEMGTRDKIIDQTEMPMSISVIGTFNSNDRPALV